MITISSTFPISTINLDEVQNLKKKFVKLCSSDNVGFFKIPDDLEPAINCLERGRKWAIKRKHFYHIGIGGSSLGPEMLIKALLPHKKNITFINNIDPDDLEIKLNEQDARDSLFYIVSKSGTTAETLATLAIIVNHLSVH